MLNHKETPKWLKYYHQQLDIRNQSQSVAFKDLIKNYSELLHKCKALEKEKLVSLVENKTPEVLQMNEKIRSLESELTGTYKEHKASTMQILEITRQLKDSEYIRKQLETQVLALKEYNDHNAEIIKQKSIIIDQLEDKVEKLQAEVKTLKEAKSQTEKQNMKLTSENMSLLNKVLSMKNEIAENINEATEIYQKGLEMMKQSTEPSVLSQFEKGTDYIEEYMVSAVSAPIKSTVGFANIKNVVDSIKAQVQVTGS